MLTYACPAECSNCGTVSSPRDRNHLSLDVVLRGIEEAHRLAFENVVFTGGEATLRWADLLTSISHANHLGLPTRLVTNAHWAETSQAAAERLDQLLAVGLDEINFSTGDEHTRFVPLDRVVFGAVAAVERGLIAHVMVELRGTRRVSSASLLQHPLIRALPEPQRERVQPTESPWMPLSPHRIETYPEGIAVTSRNLTGCVGCDSVLQTYVMQADGRVGSCCGLGMRIIPELSVGRVDGDSFLADAIAEAEADFLKLWLHYLGPEKILAWAAERDPSIEWEGMYAHRCQACIRLYRDPAVRELIQDRYLEAVPDLVQSAWLREHYISAMLEGAPAP
jgi:hypothetical protein